MEANPKRLTGRAALVTGGGRGVGKGIALALAREGCNVAINYKDEPQEAEAAPAELQEFGVEAFCAQGDVGNAKSVNALFAEVTSRFPELSILVNNAGIQIWKSFLDMEEADWDPVIETNLKGCFLCMHAAARHMSRTGGGSVINIGSGCNKLPFPTLVAYTASKGGIEMLTRVAAVELGPSGIRVNCVAPGAIEIERTRLEKPNYAETWGAVTPLRRVGQPDDVGRAVVFFASADSSFVTGQTLWVDGGLFTQGPWA